jgi:hypothetical protein
MMTGKMLSFNTDSNASNVLTYTPGGRISALKKNESRVYNLDEYTYMIDYGRGGIAYSLWQGVFAPYLFSNHDWHSFQTQLAVCAKEILGR